MTIIYAGYNKDKKKAFEKGIIDLAHIFNLIKDTKINNE